VDAELAENPSEMRADGPGTDLQSLGNCFVEMPRRDHSHEVLFPRREVHVIERRANTEKNISDSIKVNI